MLQATNQVLLDSIIVQPIINQQEFCIRCSNILMEDIARTFIGYWDIQWPTWLPGGFLKYGYPQITHY